MAENAVEKAYAALTDGIDIAIASVADTSGSSPRHSGAIMTVDANGNCWGTIGGGLLEAKSIEACKEAIRNRERSQVCHFVLEPTGEGALGTMCGGEADILVEWYSADHPEELQLARPDAPKAIIVGGGHCGYALEPVLRGVGFDVIMVDDREEYANKNRFPKSAVRVISSYDDAFKGIEADDAYIIVMTRGHMYDYESVRAALKIPSAYLGMIGSKKKIARIFGMLKNDDGFSDEEIARVFAPIGIDISAETPEEIAISIAAQIVQVRRSQLDE